MSSSSTSGIGGTLGTSGGTVSFPGIVSGIDYDSIIQQLTKLSLEPEVGLNAQIATLNNANVELTYINNLLNCVQNSLVALSNPSLYLAYSATSSNSVAATAQGISGQTAVPGTYTIEKVVTATASTVTSSATAGHSITDPLTSGPYAGDDSDTVPLADSYASVLPSNGTGTLGQITVDGVAVQYNVDSQSLDTILNNITSAVRTSADAGFLATLVGGVVEFTSSDQPISIGGNSDTGNLAQVLQLSNAELNNTANSGSITGTANVGGIDPDASFDTTTDAGYVTPVTAGYFTINGVKISVLNTQNTSDIIGEINQSDAGVVASINAATGQIVLTSTQTGPTGVVLGASGDTSNFLKAAGLTTASGATVTIGSQAEVDVQTSSGVTKYFSNSNTVTTAIPGIQLNLQSSTNTAFNIVVSQNTAQLVGAVSTFVSAYNTAITQINEATAPPIVTQVSPGSVGNAQSIGGGVLYGNSDVQNIKNEMVDIVSGFLGSGNSYNSLTQLGLQLDDSFSTITTGNNSNSITGDTGGTDASGSQAGAEAQSTTYEGTDGQLQALNVTEFLSTFSTDPSAVYSLLNGSNGLTTQLGTYLTGVTGAPTILDTGVVGVVPAISLIQNYEQTNTDVITSLQQQIQQLTDNANSQANSLRSQFAASETLIAGLQSEQQELAAALGFTVSSSSSSA